MQDLYQIVDDQDNLIGAKPRNGINFKNDYYRISGLWLTNSKGQILIAQRLLTKDKDPGKWGPAAGRGRWRWVERTSRTPTKRLRKKLG